MANVIRSVDEANAKKAEFEAAQKAKEDEAVRAAAIAAAEAVAPPFAPPPAPGEGELHSE